MIPTIALDSHHSIFGLVTQITPVPEGAFTEVTVRVIENMKGEHPGETITIRMDGDLLADPLPNAPRFQPLEYVFVFLGEQDVNGYYPIWGGINGKYSIMIEDFAITSDGQRVTTLDKLRALFE